MSDDAATILPPTLVAPVSASGAPPPVKKRRTAAGVGNGSARKAACFARLQGAGDLSKEDLNALVQEAIDVDLTATEEYDNAVKLLVAFGRTALTPVAAVERFLKRVQEEGDADADDDDDDDEEEDEEEEDEEEEDVEAEEA